MSTITGLFPSLPVGLVPLGPPVVVSSAVSQVDITLPPGYKNYKLIVDGMTPSTTATAHLRVAGADGIFMMAGYRGKFVGGASANGSAQVINDNNAPQASLGYNIPTSGLSLNLDVLSRQNSLMTVDVGFADASSNLEVYRGALVLFFTTVEKIRLYFSTGNITGGRFQLYGYKEGA